MRCFDVLALWRERAASVSGHSLPCGHYIAEEAPERLIAEGRMQPAGLVHVQAARADGRWERAA